MNTIVVVLAVIIISYLIAYYASCSQKIIVVEEVLIECTNTNRKCFISDADNTYRINPYLLGFKTLDELNECAPIEHVSIEVDKSYEITTRGWKISLSFGWCKNVVSIREVSV